MAKVGINTDNLIRVVVFVKVIKIHQIARLRPNLLQLTISPYVNCIGCILGPTVLFIHFLPILVLSLRFLILLVSSAVAIISLLQHYRLSSCSYFSSPCRFSFLLPPRPLAARPNRGTYGTRFRSRYNQGNRSRHPGHPIHNNLSLSCSKSRGFHSRRQRSTRRTRVARSRETCW